MNRMNRYSNHPYRDDDSGLEEKEAMQVKIPGNDVEEIPLLLPSWQVKILEKAAHDAGLTAGEMVRQLLRKFIRQVQSSEHIC